MKVLITGGTGFIGSRLALRCKEREYDVKVLGLANTQAEAQNTMELKRKSVEVTPVSVQDRDGLARELKDVDIVYHLAAAQHEMNVPDEHFREVNVGGTRNVIETAIEAGVKRFVHGSTIGVYGIVDGPIDESTPCNPENVYGVTKLEGEELALSYKDKLPLVVIRIPEVFGPGDRRLLKLFKVIQKNRFFMIGNGDNLHHLIYIDDLIQAFFLAAEKDEALGKVFLLAGEKPISTNKMVATIAEQLGARGSLFRVPFGPLFALAAAMEITLRPLGIQPPLHRRRMDFFKKSFELSWAKAAEILKYQPKVSFREGAKRTAAWYATIGLIQDHLTDEAQSEAEKKIESDSISGCIQVNEVEKLTNLESKFDLAAKIEPFDSFWEAPDDIERGYSKFGTFYKHNYLRHFPENKNSKILVISCGPGYMVKLLNQHGYLNVLGIDSMPEKLVYAVARNLNCKAARAFDYLDENQEPYDVIFCEQEINHLAKKEIFTLLELCKRNLKDNGTLIIHSLNGANPIVGSENLALNFDHFNLLTEKSLIQLLEHCNFQDIKPIPLKLYVFYKNPANYFGLILDAIMTKFLEFTFKFYGKKNKIFTKKIAAICKK